MRLKAGAVLLLVGVCGGEERGRRAEEIVRKANETKRCVTVPALSSRAICEVPGGDVLLGGGQGVRDQPKTARVASFWLASVPVTNAEYERFRPEHRRKRQPFSAGDEMPVTQVQWFEAAAYCEWLSKESGLKVRLPSSVEWQWACLGGTEGPYPWPDVPRDAPAALRYANVGSGKATNVGTHAPNAYGLRDMTGNIAEWMGDAHISAADGDYRLFPPPPDRITQASAHAIKNCAADNVSLVFCECNTQWAVYPHRATDRLGFRILVESDPDPSAHSR